MSKSEAAEKVEKACKALLGVLDVIVPLLALVVQKNKAAKPISVALQGVQRALAGYFKSSKADPRTLDKLAKTIQKIQPNMTEEETKTVLAELEEFKNG